VVVNTAGDGGRITAAVGNEDARHGVFAKDRIGLSDSQEIQLSKKARSGQGITQVL
jgi:hypothetical protein